MLTPKPNISLSTQLNDSTLTVRSIQRISVLALLCFLSVGLNAAESERIKLVRTPNDGIQPQVAVDRQGVVHLIYLKGDARSSDIFYVRQEPGREDFSKPIRVNTKPGSAMAVGTIRGPQMALGRNGRVHVAWNGPAPESGDYTQAPMLYTRLNDAGIAFEPERDLITFARGLDGGGSVAADQRGNVFVMWHASKPGNTEGEAGRAVFVTRSTDDGKTFASEKLATSEPTGACGCCGMKAFTDNRGNVFALYRGASENVNRNETLLVSTNGGADFEIAYQHEWKIAACPMSSASFSQTDAGILATWETARNVYFARVNPATGKVSEPISPPSSGQRKHSVAVGNARGDVLLAWAEGTGWNKGGNLAWQLFDKDGNPSSERGRAEGVPAWSLVAALAKPDGSFVIVY